MNKLIIQTTIVFLLNAYSFSWNMHYQKHQEEILAQAQALALHINNQSDGLKKILSRYQTHHTTDYEIERSVRTLNNIEKNMIYLGQNKKIGSAAIVLPSNLPLYSLVIFGLIPSFMCQEVSIRPNSLLQEKNIISDISEILSLNTAFPQVKIINVKEHSEFNPYFKKADLIVFTGSPVHAENIHKCMKNESVLIVNGSGHNPVVVTENADIYNVAIKCAHLKAFNSGQDCAGPDAILVHQNVSKEFIEQFTHHFSSIKTGQFDDPETIIGPIHKESEMKRITAILHKNSDDISAGGTYHFKTKILEPTIIIRSIHHNPNYVEMFSPIMPIHTYEKDEDLGIYFNDTKGAYQSNRMYVSVFGESTYAETRDDAKTPGIKGNVGIILKNKTIHDVEIGYEPYGGYSFGASYVLKKTALGKIQKCAMPILIPQIIAEYLIEKKDLA